MKKGESKVTTSHQTIQDWTTQRDGHPAVLSNSGESDGAETLRIDFDDTLPDPDLTRVTWEEFFEKFEASELAFLYQNVTSSGKVSRFSKFVRR